MIFADLSIAFLAVINLLTVKDNHSLTASGTPLYCWAMTSKKVPQPGRGGPGIIGREGTPFYSFLRVTLAPLVRVFFRLRGEGVENIPVRGPFILAANHVSYIDPLVLGATCPRAIHYIMLREFWEKPLLGRACRMAGAIPVDPHGSAAGTLRKAVAILRGGKVLGIFPEGGRSTDGSLQSAKGGAALLALKTGVPLLPAAIVGAERALPKGKALPRPCRVTVRYGRPISLPKPSSAREKKEFLGSVMEIAMTAIGELAAE